MYVCACVCVCVCVLDKVLNGAVWLSAIRLALHWYVVTWADIHYHPLIHENAIFTHEAFHGLFMENTP